jgi:hypothetical protein
LKLVEQSGSQGLMRPIQSKSKTLAAKRSRQVKMRRLRESQERIAERSIDENASVEDDLIAGGHASGSKTLSYGPA